MNDTLVYNIIVTYLFLDFILRLVDKFQIRTKNVTIFESNKTEQLDNESEEFDEYNSTEADEINESSESNNKSNKCDEYHLEFEDTECNDEYIDPETISSMLISDEME